MLDVKVKGLSELLKYLDQVPVNIERNIVRAGLLAGAKVIATEAKAIVRREAYQTGALEDSIRPVTFGKYRRGELRGLPVAVIAAGGKVRNIPGRKTAYYAMMVENGTRPHVIRSKKRGGTLSLFNRRVKQVNHPGMQGIRFMARAGDTKQRAALDAFAARVAYRLEKYGIEVPDNISSLEYENEG